MKSDGWRILILNLLQQLHSHFELLFTKWKLFPCQAISKARTPKKLQCIQKIIKLTVKLSAWENKVTRVAQSVEFMSVFAKIRWLIKNLVTLNLGLVGDDELLPAMQLGRWQSRFRGEEPASHDEVDDGVSEELKSKRNQTSVTGSKGFVTSWADDHVREALEIINQNDYFQSENAIAMRQKVTRQNDLAPNC